MASFRTRGVASSTTRSLGRLWSAAGETVKWRENLQETLRSLVRKYELSSLILSGCGPGAVLSELQHTQRRLCLEHSRLQLGDWLGREAKVKLEGWMAELPLLTKEE